MKDRTQCLGVMLAAASLLCLMLKAPNARADQLQPNPETGHISEIPQGIVQLGADGFWLLNYHSSEVAQNVDRTDFRTTLQIGATLNYFLAKNFHLEIRAGYLLRHQEEKTTGSALVKATGHAGALTVGVGYNAHLANGLFLVPVIGGGGFVGAENQPGATTGTINRGTLYGGHALAGLALVYYTKSGRFNLRAGVEAQAMFGAINSDNATQDRSFFEILAGFTIGFKYSF